MALSWTSSFQSRSAKDPLGASQAENAGSIPVARSRQTLQVEILFLSSTALKFVVTQVAVVPQRAL